ncbi:hypothetical protein [Corallococcus macrosporus]|uniref:SnoaL-like domain-containing protein n=1 Tax=Corallococcus macrosporus DSM 14697 TaxID=1189310 RepID=A0A250JR76_9BACT|nr:hypothetical protein [Corallococcus macrosporus]ATB45982.1 hypothetical protein MYMAC_001570 [Corallococcus macrosporus DSM 14697]
MAKQPVEIVESMLMEIGGRLLFEDDDLSGALADTNGSPFEFDEGEVERADWDGRGRIAFRARINFVGDTPAEQGENGEKVEATATGSLVHVDGKWTIESATTTSTHVVR